jgi:hypothetical protein
MSGREEASRILPPRRGGHQTGHPMPHSCRRPRHPTPELGRMPGGRSTPADCRAAIVSRKSRRSRCGNRSKLRHAIQVHWRGRFGGGLAQERIELRARPLGGNQPLPTFVVLPSLEKSGEVSHLGALLRRQRLANLHQFLGFHAHNRIVAEDKRG